MRINPEKYRVHKGFAIACLAFSLTAFFMEILYYCLAGRVIMGMGFIDFLRYYFSDPKYLLLLILEFAAFGAVIAGSALLRKKPLVMACAGALFSVMTLISWARTHIEVYRIYGNRYWTDRAVLISNALTLIFLVAFAMFFTAVLLKDEKRRIFAVICAVLFAICIVKETMSILNANLMSSTMAQINVIKSVALLLTESTFILAAIGLAVIPGKPDAYGKY
jgi:hypothetical protein